MKRKKQVHDRQVKKESKKYVEYRVVSSPAYLDLGLRANFKTGKWG